ncbi:MAG: transglycosylase SLT domain-containing protein [Acidobacteriota bacterium]|nr:MAG: transglycosylase SLT domain-containing protein [Acidobacteriota bacterium]
MKYRSTASIYSRSLFSSLILPILLIALFTVACTAQPSPSAELTTVRALMASGTLPAESVVADIEGRNAGTRTGALARLLRAHIRIEKGDHAGAAALLESDAFGELTSLGDYALWLRGRALFAAGRQAEAQQAFSELIRKYRDSIRVRDAKILWATSLLANGGADRVPGLLSELVRTNDGEAVILTANALEKAGKSAEAVSYFRRAYFYAAGTDASKEALARMKELGEDPEPRSAEDLLARANDLLSIRNYQGSADAYAKLSESFPTAVDDTVRLKRITALSKARKAPEAAALLDGLRTASDAAPEAHYQVAVGHASSRQWAEAKALIAKMRKDFPVSEWTPKAMIDAGMEARDQRRRADESEFLSSAVAAYPNAIDVAKAQFELAWLQHESGNFEISSRMLTEHLARYVDRDNSFRGQTGYWAARDSERAGKINEACALYDGTAFRYGANWYGYLALDRLTRLRRDGKCQGSKDFPEGSLVGDAVRNLKVVTVAAESAGEREVARLKRGADLSEIGLFDWSIDELKAAGETAENSPSVNLALAQHYRLKGDNVNALLTLAKSYPDYAQMFPEEMTRDEWDIFYPLTNWTEIRYWAKKRSLDPYNVAGLIRQETIFNARARSSANAYGLMQLLIPTARTMARKYGANTTSITADALYQPSLNIELGTAYMREQLSKYGRIEYMSVAYNAGPGRMVSWQRTLPEEIDEFVEKIPFNETRGYVKGVIRNSAQYRRLYDLEGRFKSNVGSKPVRVAVDTLAEKELADAHPFVAVIRTGAE